MENQVKAAAALFMLLTNDQKNATLDLIEKLLSEKEQPPAAVE